ncbi:hypothetical protein [Bradyrhizobium sp. 1(2017)]|uniref:hypothetical protein n=1 Tax=Bradyrhizobium sp. 1(2017) TaxID=1404888 RepID=UPI00140F05CF|nr:hypothetical protein [Bradyrhizobium sp. 1(2017)]QIO34327.1 hypothetical protein HAP40_22285 [Bradyrhizobium sp. 1(2017)]
MPINPSRYDMPGSFVGEIDWSPLARLGQIIKDQRDQDEAAQLIAQLYGGGAQQQPAAYQPAHPRAVAQQAPQAPAAPREQLALPPLLTPNQRVAQAFEQFPGAPSAPPPELSPNQRVAQAFEAFPGATAEAAPQPPISAPPMVPIPGATAMPVPSVLQPTPPVVAADDDLDRYARATSSIESGSPQGDYRKIGPTTQGGDRAYGRYQVMGSNVRDWTRQYFGEELSPQQFLVNPAAQDAVYRGKFGEYVQKYGPEGAARAWFAGERGMHNPNARDILGTSVSSYADRFSRAAGLPSEITAGTSRPAPQSEQPTQVTAFDRVVENLSSPNTEARSAGISREQIAALYRNPLTRPVANAFLQKMLDPGTYKFIAGGDGSVIRYNERDGSFTVIPTHQKLLTVGEDQRVFDPNTNTFVDGGGGDGARYGKLPANSRWIDPNDKSKGVEPIPGSTGEKIGDEIAARIGLGKSFISTLPQLRQRVARGDVGIDNGMNHAKALANLGTPGETKRMLDSGAEALIRMLTGAGMNETEARQNAEQYRLTAKDTAAVVTSKIDALERHLFHIGEVLGRGRGGGNLLEAPVAAPSRANLGNRAAIEAELRRRGAIK